MPSSTWFAIIPSLGWFGGYSDKDPHYFIKAHETRGPDACRRLGNTGLPGYYSAGGSERFSLAARSGRDGGF